MAEIKIRTAGSLMPGDLFIEVDDESLTTDVDVNANYDADDQDWLEVEETGGHADIGWIKWTSQRDRGISRGSWDQLVWVREA